MFSILILLGDLIATAVGVCFWDRFSGTGCAPGPRSPALAASALVLSVALSIVSLVKGILDDADAFRDAGGSAFVLGLTLVLGQILTALAVLSGGLARGALGACAMSQSIAVWTGLAAVAGFGWNLVSTDARFARWWAFPLATETAVLLWAALTLRHWAVYLLLLASVLLTGLAVARYRSTSVA